MRCGLCVLLGKLSINEMKAPSVNGPKIVDNPST